MGPLNAAVAVFAVEIGRHWHEVRCQPWTPDLDLLVERDSLRSVALAVAVESCPYLHIAGVSQQFAAAAAAGARFVAAKQVAPLHKACQRHIASSRSAEIWNRVMGLVSVS